MAKDSITYDSLITKELTESSTIGVEDIAQITEYRNGVVSDAILGSVATFDFEVKTTVDTDVEFTVNWGDDIGINIINESFIADTWTPLQTKILISEGVDLSQTIVVTDNFGGNYYVPYSILDNFFTNVNADLTALGNKLTSNIISASWGHTAASIDKITGDGNTEMTFESQGGLSSTHTFMAGLGDDNNPSGFADIEFTILYNGASQTLRAYENGSAKGATHNIELATGDKLKVERLGTEVKYYYDIGAGWVLIHTSLVVSTGDLYFNTDINGENVILNDCFIG